MKIVKFEYYDEFHCLGPECPETCCQQWDIIFGRRDYLNYKNCHCSPNLKKVIESSFVRIKGIDNQGREVNDENNNYAMIKFDENGYCPLLDDNGLCMIQKELGENALNHVCFTFPRLYAPVGNDAIIFACNTTCPHVVEMLIAQSEGLRIVEGEYDGKNKSINKRTYSAYGTSSDWIGYPYYWVIKTAQIDILQNRIFTISERLLILGFFCKKTDEYLKNKQGEKIQGLANMLLDNKVCKEIADSLKVSQSDEGRASKSVSLLAKSVDIINKSNGSSSLKKYYEKPTKSIALIIETPQNGQIDFQFDLSKYLKSVDEYCKIESERPYIIENLLVNTVFIQALNDGIWHNYFIIAMFYNLMKICIPAFLCDNWTDTDLALAITYTSKMILGIPSVYNIAAIDFMSHDSYDLPHTAFLIS